MPEINPDAILKSIEETYQYLLATGVSDPDQYRGLQAQMDRWLQRWLAPAPKGEAQLGPYYTDRAKDLSRRLGKAAENAGLVQYAAGRDAFIKAGTPSREELDRSLYEQIQKGMPLEDAVRLMIQTGRYDISEVQKAAALVGNPDYDPAATPPGGTPSKETSIGGPGGYGGYKRQEPTLQDLTRPQDEFQKDFARFTRGLEMAGTGKTPQISVLTQRYQDLYNKYLGEIEARKARGEEPANVFKEAFVNLGKSTDPQYDQTIDRLQLQTVRPKLSAFDWLTQNVDPEDVYTSTPPRERPGQSTGGFRGFVRRISR